MTRELAGLSVVVTGAGAGLGRAYALSAAAAGAAVVCGDVDGERVSGVAREIGDAGGRAIALEADVSLAETGQRLVDATLAAFGRLDGIVNNAGLIAPGASPEQSPEVVERMLAVNVAGVVHGGTAAMRAMRDAGHGGSIVNVASGALQGADDLTLYGATKAAVLGLTYGWALEGEGLGIRCNAIAPLAHTAMSDLMGTDEAHRGPDAALIAPAVVYLLGPRSRRLTGQVLRFDGRRLGLMAPPQLTHVTTREEWDAAAVADAIDGVLAPGVAPVGLARSPRPTWV